MSQLIKNLKQLGFKEFGKRWKRGIMKLTPEQLLKGELYGYGGSVIGTSIAGVVFIMMGLWPIMLFLVFNIFIQLSQFIGKYQQYNTLKLITEQMDISELIGGNE